MKPYRKTGSFCPVCGNILDTEIIEKNGSMFMRKKCPAHGGFDIKIAKYAWYYRGLDSFYNSMFGPGPGIEAQSQYTTAITQECDLNCSICFADSRHSGPADVSKVFFAGQLKKIKNNGVDINFSGGEPTLRKDLPELIRLVKDSGNQPAILTNGIRIANDIKYLKLLKNSGVKAIHLCLDTVKNPEIYKKIRGQDLTALKNKAMENLKKLNIPVRMLSVMVKGVNESEIKDLTEYARKEDIVYCHYLRSYNYMGTCNFSPDQEFLIDELAETIGRKSGLFTLEDVYYAKKLFTAFSAVFKKPSACLQTSMFCIPRGKEKPLRELFGFDTFSKKIDKFEQIWREDKKRGGKYFRTECLPRPGAGPDLDYLYQSLVKMMGGQCSPPPFSHYYLMLMVASSPMAAYDIERSRRDCTDRAFNAGVEKKIPRCLEMVNAYAKRQKP